eukprot:INCI15040.4.p1 GENE.INCI15040.4~~INCI15040.4.p1  ORF type:complete len:676 (-),score=127.79 INCI15040.4:1758-3785(-)
MSLALCARGTGFLARRLVKRPPSRCKSTSRAARVVKVKPFMKFAEAARALGVTKNRLAALVRVTEDGQQLSHRSGFAVHDAGTGRLHVYASKNEAILSLESLKDAAARSGSAVEVVCERIEPTPAPHDGRAVLETLRTTDGSMPPLSWYAEHAASGGNSSAVATSQLPVVCVLGHIDHGKTTLLDCIAGTNFTSFEVAKITQHIRAVQVDFPDDNPSDTMVEASPRHSSNMGRFANSLTFIDTPGHIAFSHSRFVGAQAADLCLVLCAVDEGPQAQTLDAFRAAVEFGTPVLPVITKSDLLPPNASSEILKSLSAELIQAAQSVGGADLLVTETPVVIAAGGDSSAAGHGVDDLVQIVRGFTSQAIALHPNGGEGDNQASSPREKVLNGDKLGEALVLEINRDVRDGMALSAIVRGNGALNTGDFFVCGPLSGRIRAIFDANGHSVHHATAGQLVKFTGVSKDALSTLRRLEGGKHGGASDGTSEDALPVGEHAFIVGNRQRMGEIAALNLLRIKHMTAEVIDDEDEYMEEEDFPFISGHSGGTDEAVAPHFATTEPFIPAHSESNGTAKAYSDAAFMRLVSDSSVLVKCDTAGSLRNALGCIDPAWGVHVVSGRIGTHVTKMDVQAAAAEDASVWGFNVAVSKPVEEFAQQMQVGVATFDVLDELLHELYVCDC